MPSYRLIPDGENRDTLTWRRWLSFRGRDRERMKISDLLKAEQARFISLIEVLIILSDHDGCEISEAAQFLYLKLSTAPNETRPRWEMPPCPLSGRNIVESRTKQWDEARSLLESLTHSKDGEVFLSEEEFGKTQIYGFDRAEIMAFMVSCGIHIDADNSVASKPSSSEKPLGTKERNTLLTIIAVLCKEAKLDHTRPAKTAGLIQSTAAGMGLSIGESTIEGHLKKIPDALGTRMK